MVGAMPVLLAAAAPLFAGARAAEERLDRFAWLALFGSTVARRSSHWAAAGARLRHGESTLTGDLLIVASLFTALA